jgi:hypothetical protein
VSGVLALVLLGQSAPGVPIVTPLVGPPTVSWLGPPPGDATGGPGYDPYLEPLRLGLLEDVPPSGDPSCRQTPEAMTASAPNVPTYYGTTLRLVPRLTLAGFSRVGCVMDGAVGGGLVYALPVRRNIDLALSAGYLFAPHAGPNGTPVSSGAHVRADLVFKRADGRSFNLGIRNRHLTFGGIF